jgi:HEAT repeats
MRRLMTFALVLLGGAVAALHAAPDEDRVADYVKALKSSDPAVRRQVAAALGEMADKAKAAVPALREALIDPDATVQSAAAAALDRIAPVARPSKEQAPLGKPGHDAKRRETELELLAKAMKGGEAGGGCEQGEP